MDYRFETINEYECVLVREGDVTHVVPLEALATWGVLLGLDDPGEVLEAILAKARAGVAGNRDDESWTEMYDALQEVTQTMAVSGVPVEYMETLMDPGMGAPVPGAAALEKLAGARRRGRERLVGGGARPAGAPAPGRRSARVAVDELAGLKGELRGARRPHVERVRKGFIDGLTPQIMVAAVPPPVRVAEDKPLTIQHRTPLASAILD